MVRLSREPIDVAPLLETSPRDGALCLFTGVVRDQNAGREVLRLEYQAYEEMALPLLEELAAETCRRFGASEVRLVHRLGVLEVGEVSVAIVVTAPHRAEAFSACRHAIDTLKARAPIWKREWYADGAVWVGSEQATG